MHSHTHIPETASPTEGRLIRWAPFYDGVVNLMTLGQARRLRLLTVDQALLKPGESILDVGCGTGSVTIPARQRVGQNGRAAGIDPAPEMIKVARQKAGRASAGDRFPRGGGGIPAISERELRRCDLQPDDAPPAA